jgi:hypothetical protein
MTARAQAFVVRTDAVERRFRDHAGRPPAAGLTEPDPPSGEQWEWGQVWAHVAEFVPYWTGQVRTVLARPAVEDPLPFGRVKGSRERVEAIERDRTVPPSELMARLVPLLDDLRGLLGAMTEQDWARPVQHSTLGVITMSQVFEVFLVGHLEAHADQLDGLVSGGPGER